MADTFTKQSIEDLRKNLTDRREHLRAVRFGDAGSRTRNVREGRTIRKEIARIMTELRAREISIVASEEKKA